jgi:hypothetical protein
MKASITMLFLLALLPAALSVVSPALAQPADDSRCQPKCTVDIDVPAAVNKPPETAQHQVVTAPGAKIDFVTNKKVTIICPDDTPFSNEDGRPVHTFNVSASRPSQQKVRTDNTVCMTEPGCKYIIFDSSNPGRPPLDPYVIIRF